MFPERTALLRPDERTRLIYRQKDVKSEYMANSISKEYIIALSTKNLDDYKRVAFSSYSGTAYTDVCTNAFGLVKVEVNGAPAYVPHPDGRDRAATAALRCTRSIRKSNSGSTGTPCRRR